jgi:membrane protease YdiL (CAAX protease family)
VFAAQHAAAGHASLGQAIGVLLDSGRVPRNLFSYAYEYSVTGLGTYAAAGAALLLAAWLFARPLRSFLTAASRFRWRLVGAGFVVAAPLVTLQFLIERIGSTEVIHAPILTPGASVGERLGYGAIAAACLYLAAFSEEALFRGWLLQQTAVRTRSLAIILAVNGVFFSLAHFDPNVTSFLVRAVMGAGWAWLALRTAGVEFTTGAHLANNLFVALFIAPVTFVAPKATPFDIRPAIAELALMGVMIGAVELWMRGRSRAAAEALA